MLDLDAFFASVEQVDEPALAGRPVVVAGEGRRGVVAAASYEARAYGVRAATPVFQARRRCPDLVVRTPRFRRYEEVSARVFDVLAREAVKVEPVSLDEAFFDPGARPALEVGGKARRAIAEELGLACTVGAGSTRLVAKLATGVAKPDGVWRPAVEDEEAFLRSFDLGDLPGVGPRTEPRLRAMGVSTVDDLAEVDHPRLAEVFGPAKAAELVALARNQVGSEVRDLPPAKSVGRSQTYEVDVRGRAEAHRRLGRLAGEVAEQLDAVGATGSVVVVSVRGQDFASRSRQRKGAAVSSRADLVERACGLFDEIDDGEPLRRLGVAVQDLVTSPSPLCRAEPTLLGLRPGDRVRHAALGFGVVEAVGGGLAEVRMERGWSVSVGVDVLEPV